MRVKSLILRLMLGNVVSCSEEILVVAPVFSALNFDLLAVMVISPNNSEASCRVTFNE